MIPLKLKPVFKDYIWGGTRLRDSFNKDCSPDRVAESWELSCHKDGNSVIENGVFTGMTLAEYIEKNGRSVLGSNCNKFDSFPVLIKLIDAKENLSVQVHPGNEYALRAEGEYGKTEMWYIADCDEDAELLYGFNKNISKDEFKHRIENNTLLEAVKSVPVKKGDVFFIKSGTLHAIGKGILIAEIQQNSNTTYRIYDYGRTGADGKPRELHTEKALEVMDLYPAEPYPEHTLEYKDGFTEKLLSRCEYFTVSLLDIKRHAKIYSDEKSFVHILILEGEGIISSVSGDLKFIRGDSFFIPSGYGEFEIKGAGNAILTRID